MTPIVTGAQIFRAKRILTAAEIHALGTTPILIAPAQPGKTLQLVAAFGLYEFGTIAFNFSGHASLYYGSLNTGLSPIGTQEFVHALVSGAVTSITSANMITVTPADLPLGDAADTQSEAIWLVRNSGTFTAGAAAAATVDPAAKGLLYALNDTGTIQVTGDSSDPTYTVTGVGAGGLVTSVTVAGGTGVVVGGPFATTVVTGIGDGTLELSITAITLLGDGTLEVDLLYQPI